MLHILTVFAQTMPAMPASSGWLAIAVLLLLGAAAFIDARTGRIPDPIIFAGVLLTTATQGFLVDWPFAARCLMIALIAGFLPYLVNLLWYRWKKRDALGMGDAKWTILAVACFGPAPAFIAWFLGAWLGLGWLGLMKIRRRSMTYIHFAPFLMGGLLAGIYWLWPQ